MEENHKVYHHHHHHRHTPPRHMDESEIFKRRTLSASKRRKIFGKVLYVVLSLLAVAIVLYVAWIYTHE